MLGLFTCLVVIVYIRLGHYTCKAGQHLLRRAVEHLAEDLLPAGGEGGDEAGVVQVHEAWLWLHLSLSLSSPLSLSLPHIKKAK